MHYIIIINVQDIVELKQEYRTLEATHETLNEQFNLLQIEKDTEVEALNKQVELSTFYALRVCVII